MDVDVRRELDWIYERMGVKPPWLVAPPVDPVIPPPVSPVHHTPFPSDPPYPPNTTVTGDVPVLSDTGINPESVGNTPYITDLSELGGVPNGYLQSRIWTGWQWIAYYLYHKYPDRQARKLEFIQACPYPGIEWLDSYHNQGLDKIDFHYFTLGPTNHTQFYPIGEPRINIWKDDGEELDLKVFDMERNLDLFIMMSKVFPHGQINVDQRIASTMGLTWLMGDSPRQYNHDRHTHIVCKGFNANVVL